MNWIVADLLMFAASVAFYLAVRRASLSKLSVQFNNLAGFTVPIVVYGVMALFMRPDFRVTLLQAGLLVLTAVVLSYISSAVSLKSIELAPNPGYSLVISKSYVVMTSLLAVPLFGAHLSVQALVAILAIVGFSCLIMINPKTAGQAKSRAWVWLAIGAFFGWGFLSLVAKYFFSHGMAPIVFLMYLNIVVALCIAIEMRVRHISARPVTQHFGMFVLIGLLASAFNFFNFTAIGLAPNVGYVNATNAASIAAVTICAIFLFKDEFSWRKLFGVFGVVVGLLLLFLT